MIGILNYGLGNVKSIQNMITKCGAVSIVSSNLNELEQCSKFILPGVGAFAYGMDLINKTNFMDFIAYSVISKKVPILGICLGAQLLLDQSEEGNVKGLGWVAGEVIKFNLQTEALTVPHMGWNQVKVVKGNKLIRNQDFQKFYFTHSYYFNLVQKEDIILETNYGIKFCSGFQKNNIYGVQFHPEKSHKYGLELIKNFIQV